MLFPHNVQRKVLRNSTGNMVKSTEKAAERSTTSSNKVVENSVGIPADFSRNGYGK